MGGMTKSAEMLTRELGGEFGPTVEWDPEIRSFVLRVEGNVRNPPMVQILGGTVAEARAELRRMGLGG